MDDVRVRHRTRVPPALRNDLPVALGVLASWFLVALDVAHVLTGLLATLLTVVHLRTRRPGVLRRVRSASGASAAVVLALAVACLLTGIARWSGVPRESAWHATASYALLGALVLHVVLVHRVLLARSRWRRRPVSRAAGTPPRRAA